MVTSGVFVTGERGGRRKRLEVGEESWVWLSCFESHDPELRPSQRRTTAMPAQKWARYGTVSTLVSLGWGEFSFKKKKKARQLAGVM